MEGSICSCCYLHSGRHLRNSVARTVRRRYAPRRQLSRSHVRSLLCMMCCVAQSEALPVYLLDQVVLESCDHYLEVIVPRRSRGRHGMYNLETKPSKNSRVQFTMMTGFEMRMGSMGCKVHISHRRQWLRLLLTQLGHHYASHHQDSTLACRCFVYIHIMCLICELCIAGAAIMQAIEYRRSTQNAHANTFTFLSLSLLATVCSFAISLVGLGAARTALLAAVKSGVAAVRTMSRRNSFTVASMHASDEVQTAQTTSVHLEGEPEPLQPHGSMLSFVRGFPELVRETSKQSPALRASSVCPVPVLGAQHSRGNGSKQTNACVPRTSSRGA